MWIFITDLKKNLGSHKPRFLNVFKRSLDIVATMLPMLPMLIMSIMLTMLPMSDIVVSTLLRHNLKNTRTDTLSNKNKLPKLGENYQSLTDPPTDSI